MTPATDALDALDLPYTTVEYPHDPDAGSYAEEAVAYLGVDAMRVFKTLVCKAETGELLVGIVPTDGQLDLKRVARAAGVKRCAMAEVSEAERSSGYVAGGISPIGQKRLLRTFLHEDAVLHDTIFVSGGRRGLELQLSADTIVVAVDAVLADIART